MNGWLLVVVLTVVLPDGRIAEQRGRANASFATLELCETELQRFSASLTPERPPGVRLVAVQAACVPNAAPRDRVTPAPAQRGSERAYAA